MDMTGDFTRDPQSAAHWVAQSPQRQISIGLRADWLLRQTAQQHFDRLLREWAATDEGPVPTRAQAEASARAELETLCRGLGRLAALVPEEIFPASG